ncbi:MAG: hypothetical protein ABMA02_10855 [Saprospiraceae bacterium]
MAKVVLPFLKHGLDEKLVKRLTESGKALAKKTSKFNLRHHPIFQQINLLPMKHLLLAFFVFSAPALAQSQCSPFLLDSLASTQPLCDKTTNDPLFWNETFWKDPVNNLQDMPECPVDLSLRLLDTCHSGTQRQPSQLWH